MVLAKVLAVALAADIVLPFAPKGDLETGWQTTDGQNWYYIQENGECVVSDWVTVDGKQYYCDSTGRMVFDIDNYRIDGAGYNFDAKGVCKNPDAASKKLTGWQKMAYSDTKFDYATESEIFIEYDYKWYFYDNGTAVTGWKKIDDKWYYFDPGESDPWMYSSGDKWKSPYYIDDVFYFFKTSGEMVTGWYFDGSDWYFARADGKLYTGEWYKENGNWYYFDKFSEMCAGVDNVKIDGIYYSFDSNGVCTNPDATAEKRVGWSKEYFTNNTYQWFYYDENGEKITGWKSLSGKWYYFDSDLLNGAMVSDGAWKIDGETYCFDDTGAMVVDGWYNNYLDGVFSEWYYFVNGKVCKGWKKIDGVWYYFNPSYGAMTENKILSIDGKMYRFSDSGAMYVGWSSYLNKGGTTLWWYSEPDGALYVDQWLNQNGNWYYFDSDAEMVANVEAYEINGISYSFDANGVCTNPDAASDKIVGWDKKEIAEDVYEWYYYDENGELCTGWQEIDGKWYYFDLETGRMNAGNILTINGKMYRFAKDGAMYIGWSSYLNKGGTTLWWYSAPDGSLFVSKWLNQNGNWYYFGSDAEMVASVENYEINGVFYTFDENGVCQNP